MKKIIMTGLFAFLSSLSLASHAGSQQLSCDFDSSGGFKTFKFKLTDYLTNTGEVELQKEIQIGSKTVAIDVLSRSRTIGVKILEARGVYTEDDMCSGGGCPVGDPKMAALLNSLISWEMGKPAMINSYVSPKKGEFYRVTCYIENLP